MSEKNILKSVNQRLVPDLYKSSAADTCRTREKIFEQILEEVGHVFRELLVIIYEHTSMSTSCSANGPLRVGVMTWSRSLFVSCPLWTATISRKSVVSANGKVESFPVRCAILSFPLGSASYSPSFLFTPWLGLVARRHYNFSHGIGRSGNLAEAQPKAIGSTILSNLTNELALDALRKIGLVSCQGCLVVPMATGMTLMLSLLHLKKSRPAGAKYVLWSRIDQKSCLKCILSAGGWANLQK